MFRKDFLVRQFEELGMVIARLMGLRKEGKWDQFNKELEKAFTTYTEYEIRDILEMDPDSFTNLIQKAEHIKPFQVKFIADLLFEKLMASEDIAEKSFQSLAQKTLYILIHYTQNFTANEYNLEVQYRIKLIQDLLNPPNPR